jgi:hypothetical protein
MLGLYLITEAEMDDRERHKDHGLEQDGLTSLLQQESAKPSYQT